MSQILCIYHGNCIDGFTAAWAVWRAHPEAEFVAGHYGEPPPDCTGRNVVMVDFSYKRDVLLQIADAANHVLILDHHKSAQAELVDLPDNVTAEFDMERSGAMMAWKYFHPGRQVGKLIEHVQDRDLWRFQLEHTKAFHANLATQQQDFKRWDSITELISHVAGYYEFLSHGSSILRIQNKQVRDLIEAGATRANIGGHYVPVLNAPFFCASDAGHILCQGEPFAAIFWHTPKGVTYSLRSSTDGGMDVSEIAQQYGGGGHKHAAGFKKDLGSGFAHE